MRPPNNHISKYSDLLGRDDHMASVFELFAKERVYRRREAQPMAEITSGGRIRFNQRATNEILSDIGDKVALGYNPRDLEIAIIKPEQIPEGTMAELFDVNPIAKGAKKSIPAKKFFNKKGIIFPDDVVIETVPEVREDPVFGKVIVLPIAEKLSQIMEAERLVAATSESQADEKKTARRSGSKEE